MLLQIIYSALRRVSPIFIIFIIFLNFYQFLPIQIYLTKLIGSIQISGQPHILIGFS